MGEPGPGSGGRMMLAASLPLLFCLLALGAPADSPAAGLLDDFQPSTRLSPHGKVSKIEFSTGLVELDPRVLVHSPAGAMRDFRFPEPVWVIGYKSTIYGPGGTSPGGHYLCHTFFGDQRVVQRQDQRMRALYSDGFTPEVQLPDGFGLPLTPHDRLHFMPMFNNRDDRPAKVGMRIEVTLIRQRDLARPLRRLYSTLRSVALPHLYYVAPRRHQRQVAFTLPFSGRIHFIGSHIHPYGVSLELFNLSRGEPVWRGSMKKDPAGRDKTMETYSSAEGYIVKPGENYRLTSLYDNTTSRPIDAMAAVFLFYSLN